MIKIRLANSIKVSKNYSNFLCLKIKKAKEKAIIAVTPPSKTSLLYSSCIYIIYNKVKSKSE